MFKKTLLVGAIALAASGVALADGFYVGAGLGGEGFHDKTNTNSAGSQDHGNLGVLGGVYGGYAFNFANQFNLGLEAFGNVTSSKISDNYTNGTTTVKARYNYGVRVLPGYQVTPDTDLHAIVGYVRGNFKVTTATGNLSKTYNANGYQLGVGSGTNLAKNVNLRGDFVYSNYQSKTVSEGAVSVKNQANTLDGIVSVGYKFG